MSDETQYLEIKITVPVEFTYQAENIANMTVPYGIYTEDYSDLEQGARDIAHIDLIDEELLNKDREHSIIHIYASMESNPSEIISYLKYQLSNENIPFSIDTGECKSSDWENNWKKFFKPTPVGERLFILPAWEKDYDSGSRAVLKIEPGLAFGSGTHETTRLCLTSLEKYVKPSSDVLDIGCGSGILSVAALLLDAKHVTGVDIDPLAIKTSEENFKMNGFSSDRFTLYQGNLADMIDGEFDVIAANIVADAIIALSPDAIKLLKNDGLYIVSGIIDIREQEVTEKLIETGFDIVNINRDNGWICIECKKTVLN